MGLVKGLMLKAFFGKETKAGELMNLAANRTGCMEVVDWALASLNPTPEQKEKLEKMRGALRRERAETMNQLGQVLRELNVDPKELRLE